jgi:hypothetical protein
MATTEAARRSPPPMALFRSGFYFKPLVLLIWLGALIMFVGGGLSLSDRRLRIGTPARERALPFIRTDDGTAPGEAQECQSEAAAIRRAEGMSRDPANAGAVAFTRAGDPNVGEFSDAVVLKKFGDVPEDLSAL